MKRIGIISDTHGYWDDKYEYYLGECDEIWHAGDIGSLEVADKFEAMKPIFRAVCGNIDDNTLRNQYHLHAKSHHIRQDSIHIYYPSIRGCQRLFRFVSLKAFSFDKICYQLLCLF